MSCGLDHGAVLKPQVSRRQIGSKILDPVELAKVLGGRVMGPTRRRSKGCSFELSVFANTKVPKWEDLENTCLLLFSHQRPLVLHQCAEKEFHGYLNAEGPSKDFNEFGTKSAGLTR
ncbi:RanBP-type and C3HC4-type zinc finger-containing protein 1 [Forsythia ovata]|uniref:RanBP-type and C3HC4-type zinc finger-containing protein 1 n=1 Tax=Forsythia ovata TaxID=205694 RepID=A0ABD1S1T3_9LAMI